MPPYFHLCHKILDRQGQIEVHRIRYMIMLYDYGLNALPLERRHKKMTKSFHGKYVTCCIMGANVTEIMYHTLIKMKEIVYEKYITVSNMNYF